MILVDVHAHLDFDVFSDIDDLIKIFSEKGVKVIIVNGVHPQSNRKVQALAQKYEVLKAAYGYYPVHIAEDGIEKFKEELSWIEENKPVALGEIGLDYKVGDDNPDGDLHKEVQIEAFRLFIRLGKKLGIPLIIHSRKAEEDVLDILEEEKAKDVIMHCFMGKKKFVERARDLGYVFSIPVTVVKLEQLQWIVRHVPLSQLLTETDAPYQSPVRGERNDSSNISLSIEKIAQIKELEPEEVANNIFMNYQKLF